MNYLDVGRVLLSVVAGLGLGFLLPLRCCRRLPGFWEGMVVGGPVTSLGGALVVYLVASWGEDLLGTTLGVPFGLFLRCLGGTFALNFLIGRLGAGVARLWKRP